MSGHQAEPSQIRVGQGFDSHRFSDDPERVLVLGGVKFDGHAGLVGHSDADVVAHACIDALLGAADLGDIGQAFPDTDPGHADADSIELLKRAVVMLAEDGWSVVNVDCTAILEQPKIAPMRDEMMRCLSEAVGGTVSVKGKRAEQMGSLGRGEGVAAIAVALIQQVGSTGMANGLAS